MYYCCVQVNVDFIRLGRLERIHSELQSHAADRLTKSLRSVEQLTQFYKSKVEYWNFNLSGIVISLYLV